jgi:purine-nucleoside phosphorylase
VNLTWRSPLTGRNNDRLGPRFPVIAGMYEPGLVLSRVGPEVGLPVELGVVAGVRDHRCLLEFESRMVREQDLAAFSSELVPVALVAAHLGIRLAAAVVVLEEE